MRRLRWSGIVVVAVFAVATEAAAQPVAGMPGETAALARFDAAVASYLRAHRFPDPVDLEALCLPEGALNAGPRFDEPPIPTEGAVFTADVDAMLRTRIAALGLPAPTTRTRAGGVAAGDRLTAGRTALVPKALAAVLPEVPADLDYRLAGADLVLVDLRTNVVIDLLRAWRG
jgi:hypothetical protein